MAKLFRKSRLRREDGFTLIELLVVVAIIGILSLLVIPNVQAAIDKSHVNTAKADGKSFQTAMEQYFLDKSTYPSNLSPSSTQLSTATDPDGIVAGTGSGSSPYLGYYYWNLNGTSDWTTLANDLKNYLNLGNAQDFTPLSLYMRKDTDTAGNTVYGDYVLVLRSKDHGATKIFITPNGVYDSASNVK